MPIDSVGIQCRHNRSSVCRLNVGRFRQHTCRLIQAAFDWYIDRSITPVHLYQVLHYIHVHCVQHQNWLGIHIKHDEVECCQL
jgi:hypothetical protein